VTGRLLAVDPGNVESGFVVLEPSNWIADKGIVENAVMLAIISDWRGELAIERITNYGMVVGQSIFETCVWHGRFIQAYAEPDRVVRVPRQDVKRHLCHSTQAKDKNVNSRLLDLWGPKGRKADPGPTFGMAGDMWAALGVAATVRGIEDPLEWDTLLTQPGILA